MAKHVKDEDDFGRGFDGDFTKFNATERKKFVDKLIKHIENDNLRLLQEMRKRTHRVKVKLPKVEVRYKNLRVEADCEVVSGKPLPTLWNAFKSVISDFVRLVGFSSQGRKMVIINDVSGILKPGRMTLLLGLPGCGKTTLLKALSGNLNKSLKVTGEVSYNGYKLEEFVPQKTSAYVSQNDLHIPEMTVRETLDFSAQCQGVGSWAEVMTKVHGREKLAGVVPDPSIDMFMKAMSTEGQTATLQTDYIMKVLGLDICSDTLFGDAMRTGISGGQKKRLTTGEMIVGPMKVLFMDEISNGLDSSTTHQIITYLQQRAHITDATVFVALLQPAPETFDLFDDIVLMAEGKVLYHGPCCDVLDFFEARGFKCPERKAVADFLQEVISRKDQSQYWKRESQTYRYVSVDKFCRRFKESSYGRIYFEELSNPLVKTKSGKDALSFKKYSLSNWTLFRACMSREFLLMKRNSFIYVFKSVQLVLIAVITMTVYFRSWMAIDLVNSNKYMCALFFALTILFFDSIPEMSMTLARLPGFYKQRDLYFYPAWAYAIPASVLKVPISLLEALIWTSLTYYTVGFSPEVGRFFRQFILFFAVHSAAVSMFRFMASVCRSVVAATTTGSLVVMFVLLFSGFIIPRSSMPVWLKWGFWISPLSYGELGLALNEFLAPRWENIHVLLSPGHLGDFILEFHGLLFKGELFWMSVVALIGFTILFNVGFILALTFLNPPGTRAIISNEKLTQGIGHASRGIHVIANPTIHNTATNSKKGRMILPFEPLTIVFENVRYYVDSSPAMREKGFLGKKLQLLRDVTGALRPGILTALMGVSGAGKTTLLDVLSGRKTSGTIEGEIRIGGYPKVQKTFARVSGYCEQIDIHSPQITVEESVVFSAWLRLDTQIDSKTKYEFVKAVFETIELDGIKDSLVGVSGVSGLSTEQRKRLTIAVELVANPSIIFMDEPTTGLDARAAAIVMRAVKNIGDTGRTIVCTIHQPSIHIFEAFDELILLKAGGRVIYSGALGPQSSNVIEYFEGIPGVPKINKGYNPSTWMLEVTSTSAEAELSIDFASLYETSVINQNNKKLVKRLRKPPPGSRDLYFPARFSQTSLEQFKFCMWKQRLSYWRSPSYNLMRATHTLVSCLVFGALFWRVGKDVNAKSLFIVIGSMYGATIFLGFNNCSAIVPYVSMERSVLYRERFAGMYGAWAYALAQVAIEIPYILAQTIVLVAITYPMAGYYWSAYKIMWYFYALFCTLLYFTYLGMLLVSATPTYIAASVLSSTIYILLNLFTGYLVPQPQVPVGWMWMYYLSPTSWSLKAMLTSQFGDIDTALEFPDESTVKEFLNVYFGFRSEQLPLVAILLAVYPIVFASLFALCIQKLNFQKR